MSSYGVDDSLEKRGEKFLAVHIYLFRKLFLGLVLVLVGVAERVSNWFGFNFSVSVSDRESWKWEPYKKLPLYRARVEKVN